MTPTEFNQLNNAELLRRARRRASLRRIGTAYLLICAAFVTLAMLIVTLTP